MEPKKSTSPAIAGLIISAVLIVYSLILQFTNQYQNTVLGFLSYAILFIGLIYFINQYGKSQNNTVGFGGLFGYGFKATAVITLVCVAFMLAYFLAFPEAKEKIIEAARLSAEDSGQSESQIEEGMKMYEKNFYLFMIGGGIFGYLVMGCIASLIGAAVTKKKPANPIDQLDM